MATFEFGLKSCDIDGKKIIEKRGLESGGKVQQKIDSECLRLMDPYIPKDTGALRDSGILNTEIGSGKIIYSNPYARKQYYIPMQHGNGAKRTDYWFENMKADGGKEKLLNVVKRETGAK